MDRHSLARRVLIRTAIDPALRFLGVSRLVRSPAEFALELTNHCNLSCVMCFREKMTRPKAFMDVKLARRVVDELRAFPKTPFLPQGFGESLLHPEFVDLLSYARSVLPNPIAVISNGTLLVKEMARKIVEGELADVVVISVESTEKTAYESIRRKGNFEQLNANVTNLLMIKRSLGKTKPSVCIRGVVSGNGALTVEALRNKWGDLLSDNDCVAVNEFRSWVGAVDGEVLGDVPAEPARKERRLACRQLFKTFMVGVDGNVTPCCYDYNFSLCIGNVNETSLRDIWMGGKLAALRNLHLQGRFSEAPLCKDCQDWE